MVASCYCRNLLSIHLLIRESETETKERRRNWASGHMFIVTYLQKKKQIYEMSQLVPVTILHTYIRVTLI